MRFRPHLFLFDIEFQSDKLMNTVFRIFLALSAISIAGCAAFFSVSGISELFTASKTSVIVMAGSLEFGKLVAASFLHQYWSKSSGLLKAYLTTGVIVLMIITSLGIFGFLTNAYEQSASKLQQEETKISTLNEKADIVQSELESFKERRSNLTDIRSQQTERLNSITSSDSLNSNEIGYLTRQTQDRIESADKQLSKVNAKISILSDSLSSLKARSNEIKSSSTARAELGPLLFVAREFNTSPDTAITWFTLMIIFVFDPLAVSLVLAFNTTFDIQESSSGESKDGDESDNDNGGGNEEGSAQTTLDPENDNKNYSETSKEPINEPVTAKKTVSLSDLSGSKSISTEENKKTSDISKEPSSEKTTLSVDELFEKEKNEEEEKEKEVKTSDSNDKDFNKGKFKEGPVLKTPDSEARNENSGKDELDEFVEEYSGSEGDDKVENSNSRGTKRVDFHGNKKTEREDE